MDRSGFLAAFINEEPVALDHVWLRRLRPITEAEYRYRCADAAWLRQNEPEHPAADPTKRIDHLTVRPPY